MVWTQATTHRFSALHVRFEAFGKSRNGRNAFTGLDARGMPPAKF
jgi:hypothetical protein